MAVKAEHIQRSEVDTSETLSAETLLKDPRILNLIERMLDGRIQELHPQFSHKAKLGFAYPEAEDVLESETEDALTVLDRLATVGVLSKNFQDKLFVCPNCQSPDVRIAMRCPKCGAGRIVRDRMIEHYTCAFVGTESEFKSGEALVCPKCRRELKLIGTDYRDGGQQYKCLECAHFFSEPSEVFGCTSCQKEFSKHESGELSLFSYRLNKGLKDWIALHLGPKRQLEQYFRGEGYDVQTSTRVQGSSGAEHFLDLLAVKKGILEQKVLVGFAYGKEEVPAEEVLKLFAKGYDIGAKDIILVAVPKLSSQALNFASFYKMRVFEGEDLAKAVSGLGVIDERKI